MLKVTMIIIFGQEDLFAGSWSCQPCAILAILVQLSIDFKLKTKFKFVYNS